MLEDAAPLRVAKRASGAVSPIPGTASLGQEEPFQMQTLSDRERTGIMSAVNETMRCVFFRIVEEAPGVGVLARFSRIPGPTPRCPNAVMRLEPQSNISPRFSHPQ